MPLREEVYALDGSEAEGRPYLVTEHNYTIELLQPAITPRPGRAAELPRRLPHPRPRDRHRALRARALPGGRRAAGRPADHPRPGAGRRRLRQPAAVGVGRVRPPVPRSGSRRRGPGDTGPAAADLHRERATPTRWNCRTPTARPMPAQTRTSSRSSGCGRPRRAVRLRRTARWAGRNPAELPFQDWNADQDRLPAPARRLIARTRSATGATTCPGRFRSASWSRSRCRTGATARPSPTA